MMNFKGPEPAPQAAAMKHTQKKAAVGGQNSTKYSSNHELLLTNCKRLYEKCYKCNFLNAFCSQEE